MERGSRTRLDSATGLCEGAWGEVRWLEVGTTQPGLLSRLFLLKWHLGSSGSHLVTKGRVEVGD